MSVSSDVQFPHLIAFKVFGSITGVRLIIAAFPNIGRGPRLSIDIHRGALTEGCLTFAIVSISLGLSRRSHASTFMKTWISSLSKLTLHILGSDLTGGCMNPASVSTSLCYKVYVLWFEVCVDLTYIGLNTFCRWWGGHMRGVIILLRSIYMFIGWLQYKQLCCLFGLSIC